MVAEDDVGVESFDVGAQARSASTFAHAFREATDQRGLSLERITYHLRRRGHDLSAATLSYWRTGRSVPQRSASIAALGALEEILGVDRGSLAALVPPRPVRTAVEGRNAVRAERFIKRADIITDMMASLGLTWDTGFEYISTYDRISIARDGTLDSQVVSALLRATRDGIDRLPAWYGLDDARSYPYVSAEVNCRVGGVREGPNMPLIVAELLLPRPMNVGDVLYVEYRFGAAGQTMPINDWNRGFIAPIRDAYQEVSFHPQAMPVKAQEIIEVGSDERSVSLPVTDSALRRYRRDFGPGVWGMRWEWSPGTLAPTRAPD